MQYVSPLAKNALLDLDYEFSFILTSTATLKMIMRSIAVSPTATECQSLFKSICLGTDHTHGSVLATGGALGPILSARLTYGQLVFSVVLSNDLVLDKYRLFKI